MSHSLTENARKILEKRYFLKNDKGEVIEDWPKICSRVARFVSSAEVETKRKEWEEKFYTIMYNLEYVPSSPILFNAGTKNPQCNACFVCNPEDSLESIFKTVRDSALIYKSGGGCGFYFGDLRPANAIVGGTGGVSSGPISFMKVFDVTVDVVKQGSKRRGAAIGLLPVYHPDIEEFITCKADKKSFENFNLSVGITDEFMDAVERNKLFELRHEKTGVVRKVKARKLWNKIVRQAHKTGDPGLLFLDTVNRFNPIPKEPLRSVNPCLPGNIWIMTSEGPRMVIELVGIPFRPMVNGYPQWSKTGFWSTGMKEVFQIKTKRGYVIEATDNHKFHMLCKEENVWREVKNLKVGDSIALSDHRYKVNNNGWGHPSERDEDIGWLLGSLVGDGHFVEDSVCLDYWNENAYDMANMAVTRIKAYMKTREDFGTFPVLEEKIFRVKCVALTEEARKLGIISGHKKITDSVEKQSICFYKGFLRGLFDADGSVQGTQSKGVSVRLNQSDLELLQRVQRMLSRLGIISTIYENRKDAGFRLMPDGKGGQKEYYCVDNHELVISGHNLQLYFDLIGFDDSIKMTRLAGLLAGYKRSLNYQEYEDEIISITSVGTKEVFDTTIDDGHEFCGNGFRSHNCGEQPLGNFESCVLGSINLVKFVKSDGTIDYDRLKTIIYFSIRFLDNTIDINKYPLREIEEASKRNRKIGLGVMGFADMLLLMKIKYDSDEAFKFFLRKVMRVRYTAI